MVLFVGFIDFSQLYGTKYQIDMDRLKNNNIE